MRRVRTYSALILLMVFCCYYSGISMFSHVHIVNGSSVVHSHLGGTAEHDHSASQYAVIDILSHFDTESAVSFCTVGSIFFQLSELCTGYYETSHLNEVQSVPALRGPPMV